jgi:hypothetical protein
MSRDLEFLAQQMVSPRRRDPNDRERLAEAAHRKRCAKHKGRNHWANWERRQMAAEKRAAAEAKTEKRQRAWAAYVEQVRAYWSGDRRDLPRRPA